MRIVAPGGTETSEGGVGELQVRGPTGFAGYWGRPEATSAAFVDGWFRTGDLAERAADGYVTLRGRASDLVISGGFNIYPREIEEFLYSHPDIEDVQVIGVPDEKYGEEVCAWIVLRPGETATEDEIRSYCRERIANTTRCRATCAS